MRCSHFSGRFHPSSPDDPIQRTASPDLPPSLRKWYSEASEGTWRECLLHSPTDRPAPYTLRNSNWPVRCRGSPDNRRRPPYRCPLCLPGLPGSCSPRSALPPAAPPAAAPGAASAGYAADAAGTADTAQIPLRRQQIPSIVCRTPRHDVSAPSAGQRPMKSDPSDSSACIDLRSGAAHRKSPAEAAHCSPRFPSEGCA